MIFPMKFYSSFDWRFTYYYPDGPPVINRGIAKAIAGDKDGAIKDFQTVIELNENEATDEQAQGYIDTLRAGENPFTEEEIKRLLGE